MRQLNHIEFVDSTNAGARRPSGGSSAAVETEESSPSLSPVRMGVECSDQQEQGSDRARFMEL